MAKRDLMTLDEVKQVAGVRNYKHDKPVSFAKKGNEFHFDGNYFVLAANGKQSKVTNEGVKYLTKLLKLPVSLPKKLDDDPDLMANILNFRSHNTGAELRPVKKNKTIVSFIEGQQNLISTDTVLNAIEENVKGPKFDSFDVSEDGSTSFNIVATKGKPLTIGKHDSYFDGVRISNNPLEASSTKVETYLQRLVCLNGSVAPQIHWSAPRNAHGDMGDWLADSIKSAVKESRKMFTSISKLSESEIDVDLADFIDNTYEQLKVPENVRDLITRRIMKHGAKSMYDIFNHITYVASNYTKVRSNADLSARLMRIGGHFAQHIEDMCKACSRPILSQ